MKKDYSIEQQLAELNKKIEDYSNEIVQKAKLGLQAVANSAHSLIIDKAQNKLGSQKNLYIESLSVTNEGDNLWVIALDPKANWIEDGRPAYDMLPGLLNGPKAKVGKDGKKYNIIPFKQNKRPQDMSRSEKRMADFVQQELKRLNLDKTIKDESGNPVIGKAAKVNLDYATSVKSRIPLLQGLTIYQRKVTNEQGKESIKRDIMTFRVASEKQIGSGKWWHKETKGLNAFKDVEAEIDQIWAKMIQEVFK
jgi:hypothetical protein